MRAVKAQILLVVLSIGFAALVSGHLAGQWRLHRWIRAEWRVDSPGALVLKDSMSDLGVEPDGSEYADIDRAILDEVDLFTEIRHLSRGPIWMDRWGTRAYAKAIVGSPDPERPEALARYECLITLKRVNGGWRVTGQEMLSL